MATGLIAKTVISGWSTLESRDSRESENCCDGFNVPKSHMFRITRPSSRTSGIGFGEMGTQRFMFPKSMVAFRALSIARERGKGVLRG